MESNTIKMPAKNTQSMFSNMRGAHVALRVPNFEESKKWYVEKLDFRVLHEWPFGDLQLAYLAPANDDNFWIELLAGGTPAPKADYTDLSESLHPAGYYVLFKKDFINAFPNLKATIDKFQLFTDKSKNVIRLSDAEVPIYTNLFVKMQEEDETKGTYREDALQAYLQLLMVESMKLSKFLNPDVVSEEFSRIHQFFNLLEKEASIINYDTPIRIKTAKEFAAALAIHPNYLNELLKKHTGQNTSTHIRNRLLEEAKVLLLQTDWNLNSISYMIGFSDLPNFSYFFKKNTGLTPVEFRKSFMDQKTAV